MKETPKLIKEEEKEKIESRVADIAVKSSQEKDQGKKISTRELSPSIPKVLAPTKAREEIAKQRTVRAVTGQVPILKVSPPLLLDHTELQAMVNYLDYEIFPGRGVRFRYSDLPDDHMGHMWFLKRPRDLRGKTVRIDYQGYVPREMTFRIAKSGTSAAVEKKVVLEDSPYEQRSIFIDLPNTTPFREVKHLEFWIERETAGRTHGDFMIEKVVVLEGEESGKQVANESRPEPFPFDRPFVPTNLMRSEVPVS